MNVSGNTRPGIPAREDPFGTGDTELHGLLIKLTHFNHRFNRLHNSECNRYIATR